MFKAHYLVFYWILKFQRSSFNSGNMMKDAYSVTEERKLILLRANIPSPMKQYYLPYIYISRTLYTHEAYLPYIYVSRTL